LDDQFEFRRAHHRQVGGPFTLEYAASINAHHVRIDFRFGLGDPERRRKYAAELVALSPDVLVSGGSSAFDPLQRATPIVPIVFWTLRAG
jgi:hypothetical protein